MRVLIIIVMISALSHGAAAQVRVADPGSFAPDSVLASISVSDLDRAVAWYGANFGFRVVKELTFPPDVRISFAENGKLTLELAEIKGTVPFRTVKDKIPGIGDRSSLLGFYKIGFYVADLESETERLKKNGATFLYGPSSDKDSGDKWLIVADPDGNLVQLIEHGDAKAGKGNRR